MCGSVWVKELQEDGLGQEGNRVAQSYDCLLVMGLEEA